MRQLPRCSAPHRIAAMAGRREVVRGRRRSPEREHSVPRLARGTSHSHRLLNLRGRERLAGTALGQAAEARRHGRRVVQVIAGIPGPMEADRNCRFLRRWCVNGAVPHLNIRRRRSTPLLAAAGMRRPVDIRPVAAAVIAVKQVCWMYLLYIPSLRARSKSITWDRATFFLSWVR